VASGDRGDSRLRQLASCGAAARSQGAAVLLAAERPAHDLEGGGVELRLTVASEAEMRPWVLGWGAQVEVLAPASLRGHVARSMAAAAQLYAGD
jgi:predicted DNA-binding transcriptional regulator YafY